MNDLQVVTKIQKINRQIAQAARVGDTVKITELANQLNSLMLSQWGEVHSDLNPNEVPFSPAREQAIETNRWMQENQDKINAPKF